ncbi:MAG: hypothetical protein LBM98_03795 [Oscillospiraceae bacterium]|nr:hypothetical protein [Oscillospiraceae bacterium]
MLRTCNTVRIASLPVLRNDGLFSFSRFDYSFVFRVLITALLLAFLILLGFSRFYYSL